MTQFSHEQWEQDMERGVNDYASRVVENICNRVVPLAIDVAKAKARRKKQKRIHFLVAWLSVCVASISVLLQFANIVPPDVPYYTAPICLGVCIGMAVAEIEAVRK